MIGRIHANNILRTNKSVMQVSKFQSSVFFVDINNNKNPPRGLATKQLQLSKVLRRKIRTFERWRANASATSCLLRRDAQPVNALGTFRVLEKCWCSRGELDGTNRNERESADSPASAAAASSGDRVNIRRRRDAHVSSALAEGRRTPRSRFRDMKVR